MKSLDEPRGLSANPLAGHMPPSPRMSPRMRRVRPSSQERQQRREVRRALGELQEVRRAPIECQEIRRSPIDRQEMRPIDRQEMRLTSERQQYETSRRSSLTEAARGGSQDSNIIPRDRSGDRTDLRRTAAERQEIKEYLEKLRHLVPACPKAGKLSRLTVIQHVIDYIVELQDTLVHHPVNAIDSLVQGATDPVTAIMSHVNGGHPAVAAITVGPQALPSPSALTNNTMATTVEGAAVHADVPPMVASLRHNGIKDNTNSQQQPSVRSKTTTSASSTSSTGSKSSKKSSCRRPLGVLSSLKNNRMH